MNLQCHCCCRIQCKSRWWKQLAFPPPNFRKLHKKPLSWGIGLIEFLSCGGLMWKNGSRRWPEESPEWGIWVILLKPWVENRMFLILSGLIPNDIKNILRFTQHSRCENSAAELNRVHYISERALMDFCGAQPKNIMSRLCISCGWDVFLLLIYFNFPVRGTKMSKRPG